MLPRAALGIGRTDPEACPAVGPADRFRILVGDLEAKEGEQLPVEGFRPRIVADPDHQVVDTDDAHHAALLPIASAAKRGGQGRGVANNPAPTSPTLPRPVEG